MILPTIRIFALPLKTVGVVCLLQVSSHAATFTVNGFTGAFAPVEWTISNTAGGNTLINATDSTLTTTVAPGSATSFIFDTNTLAATYPGFTQGTARFNWNWTASIGATPFFASNLEYQINNVNPVQLTRYTGPNPPTIPDVSNINNFIVSGNNVSFNVVAGDSFLFRLQAINAPFASSTAVISSFSFTGTDGAPGPASVPAPVPVLGAAVAFAFGRRIRRRLSETSSKLAS